MRRREFITLLGGAAVAWPLGARAQAPVVPVIGVLGIGLAGGPPRRMPAFHRGLKETGYIEGKNVAIEYRRAEGQYDRIPELMADLVRRQVAVIAATGGSAVAVAAKASTSTIPIVFTTGDDAVQLGLVASLSRPGGNATGVSLYTTELVEKRLELLREIVPRVTTIALLVPGGPYTTQFSKKHAETAARATGLKVLVFELSIESDIEAAFASAAQQGVGALLVSAAPFFVGRRTQIVALAERYQLPAIYPWREFIDVGGLMSYGPDIAEAYYQVGRYTGRILGGVAPSDLPVQLPTKFDLVINLKTAKALGLTVSRLLNARADKVLE